MLPVACPWSVVLSGYSVSSTTETGRHDIAEILLKVAFYQKSNQINIFRSRNAMKDSHQL
jgi:hypothetical protein